MPGSKIYITRNVSVVNNLEPFFFRHDYLASRSRKTASSFCVVLITSYQVSDCNLDEINKGRHCQQERYHGHWELPIWIHRQSQMVLLTLFAGDGGYNPQLQRVGEGETFLHGYLTIHVIINPTHNACNFHTFIQPICKICRISPYLIFVTDPTDISV